MTCGDERDKKGASSPFFFAETCSGCGRREQIKKWWIFREGRCNFSLGFQVFGPSDHFELRSKVVLHIEDYTWTSVSGVFDKLREVWVSSYLFYSWFKCFVDVCVGLRP